MLGIALTLSAVGIISAISVSHAHSRGTSAMMDDGMMDDGDMMSGSMMPMMHSMMMNGDEGMMNCMSMMKNRAQMTQEEIEEMLKSMDKDGDGLCDYCGMPVEMCRKMMNS